MRRSFRKGCDHVDCDMTVPCGDGIVNIRAGAIIMRDGMVLMVGNDRADYLYSVGGRVRFGETAAEAAVREVFEETGTRMEVDRLGFIHENLFSADAPGNEGKPVYEISFFFYMKVPEDFCPRSGSTTADQSPERLYWIRPQDERTYYPAFFRTELEKEDRTLRHIVTDELGTRRLPRGG